MAKVIFHTPAGIRSYKAHMRFSITPDPYPDGVTVNEGGIQRYISNITNGSYITIKSSELGEFSSLYGFPITFTWSGSTSGSDYFSYISDSNTISIPVGSQDDSLTDVYCYAEQTESLRYYRVHYRLNDGSGDDGYKPSYTGYYASETDSPIYDLSNIPTPTRDGYTFGGWAYTSLATTGYKDTIELTATSKDPSNPTINNIYAVWQQNKKYRVHAYGNGGKSGGSEDVYVPSSTTYYETDTTTPVFFLSNIPTFTRDKYVLVGWAHGNVPSEGETVYTGSITMSATASGTTNAIHAVWREQISPFYWFGNETDDTNKVKQGQPRKMNAEMWDNFADTVDTLASICGISVSIDRPSDGTPMKHEQYNSAVSALAAIKGSKPLKFISVTIPNPVDNGDSIAASQFQGTGSIKGALNAMIALL